MPDLEIRSLTECRVGIAPNGRTIEGYAIVFDSLSQDLGGFREVIRPEAVDRTLKEALDVRALVDHDSGKVIGRTRAGTLNLRKDPRGLRVSIDPPNTTAGRDILESISRGDVSGMSFAFRALTDDWRTENGTPVRDVSDMTISEVSVVAFPAYSATNVDVAQRSLREFQARQASSPIALLRRKLQLTLAR